MQRALTTIFLMVWTGLMLVGDYVFASKFLQQSASKNYHQTTGEVTKSEIKNRSHTSHGGIQDHYADAIISYVYKVNGQSFESKRYAYLKFNSANSIIESRPIGGHATVFYNPNNPQDAVLSPGLDDSCWIALKVAVFLNALILMVWFFIWVKMRQEFKKPS